MASSTHQFGVLDLIRAGLQDLDTARTLLDELRADGIDDDRLCLLMKTLEQTCEPDIALRNLVDIIKALQSQGRDFHQVITDDAGLVRLVTVLGVSDEMGKLMRFRPELVMAAASDSCESHLYNHAQRRAHVLEAVGADPADNRMPKATKPLAEAATALRQTYRKQLAAIMAQDATADDPTRNTTENQPGTVRSCRRGPGRRARHRPQRSGRQRTRALRHHRHGQARRTRTQLRIRRGPHLRGGTGGRGHQTA